MNLRRRFAFYAAALVTLCCTMPTDLLAQVNKELPILDLKIKGAALKAELANSAETRSTGLMNRFSLRPNHGMVFVFPEATGLAMWMKNTYVPLSVAFIDSKGVILNIADMKPQTLDSHPSAGPALYALEMKLGWFKEKGIAAGDKIEGLDKAGKARD